MIERILMALFATIIVAMCIAWTYGITHELRRTTSPRAPQGAPLGPCTIEHPIIDSETFSL